MGVLEGVVTLCELGVARRRRARGKPGQLRGSKLLEGQKRRLEDHLITGMIPLGGRPALKSDTDARFRAVGAACRGAPGQCPVCLVEAGGFRELPPYDLRRSLFAEAHETAVGTLEGEEEPCEKAHGRGGFDHRRADRVPCVGEKQTR